MGFSISKAFKKITKPFKSIAKRIKRAASKVMGGIMKLPGFKQLGQLYAKTFGKLGPLGMIAASFILPGIGSLIASGWASAIGGLAGSGSAFLQAVGSGMQAISTGLSTASGAISQGFSAVTDKIGQAFAKVGGSISNGASKMFNAASEWTKQNLPGTHANLSKMGDWVANKAQDLGFGEGASLQETNATLQANPELLKAVQPQKVAGDLFQATGGEAAQVGGQSLLTRETLEANPEFAKFNQPQQVAEDLTKATQGRSTGTTFGVETQTAGNSFAKKALKAGAALLAPSALPPEVPEFLTGLPSIGDDFLTQRFGAGGSGAVGGQFLTPQQQAFFAQHAKLLGQAG